MDGVCGLGGRDSLEFNANVPGEEETGDVLWEEVVGGCDGVDEFVLTTTDWTRRHKRIFIQL